ncbi:MAG: hypothetical protein AB7R90_04140 [Reyranellaceae bacterium]
MAQLAAPLMIASAAVSAGSSVLGGLYANSAGKAMQKQYRHQANTERAVAQRQAIRDAREGELAQSRAVALMAASGGGGIETAGGAGIVGGINEQKYLNYMTSLWNGENRAQGLLYQGQAARAEGRQRLYAGFLDAGSTLLSAAAGGGYR